ncbi:M23 family metallopeptidase, partial [Brevibacterium mcbrellneri]|uniref:M23 family metallopeptidase n=1 Tax=Brevibacterium mcbrellneri TaxID=53363 RepID=UPI0012E9C4E4
MGRRPLGRTNLWDRIPGCGYVSDGWVDTGTNGPLKGVPTCTDAPSQPTRAPQPTTPPQPQQDYQYPFTSQFFLPFTNGASYPIAQGSFSSDPSWSRNAANATFGTYNKHAIDFGTRLLATGPGVIRTARWDSYGYGYKVVIDHGNDRCTVISHLSRVDVKAGDKVVAGGQGGLSGNTGNSTDPTPLGRRALFQRPVARDPQHRRERHVLRRGSRRDLAQPRSLTDPCRGGTVWDASG